jgi:hypothetical protein
MGEGGLRGWQTMNSHEPNVNLVDNVHEMQSL